MAKLQDKPLAERYADYQAEQASHEQFLVLFPLEAESAVAEDLRKNVAPFSPGSTSFELQERKAIAVSRLEKLNQHILPAIKSQLDAERAEQLERELGELRVRLAEVNEQERELWRVFAARLRAAIEAYLALGDHLGDYAELRQEGISRGLSDPEVWMRECHPVIRPFPADFTCAVTRVLAATADPDGVGVVGPLRQLAELLPDMRPVYRHPSIPSGIEKVYESTQAERGSQPIGYTNFRLQQKEA